VGRLSSEKMGGGAIGGEKNNLSGLLWGKEEFRGKKVREGKENIKRHIDDRKMIRPSWRFKNTGSLLHLGGGKKRRP